MKKGRKFLSILGITGALVCMMYRGVQADSGIVMDGSFYDWESISHVSIDAKDSFYNQIAIKMDEQYIYMHCVEQQPNLWNPFSYMNFQVTLEDDSTKGILFTTGKEDGSKQEIIVRNQNGYSEIEGAIGYRYVVNGLGEWEVQIPLSRVGKVTKISAGLNYGTDVKYEPTQEELKLSQKEETTEESSESTKPEETETKEPDTGESKFGMVMDGYFDDWADKMHHLVINWDMPDSDRNVNNCRQLSVVYDDEHIYFHIIMRRDGNEEFNGNEYTVTVDGKSVTFYLRDQYDNVFPGNDRTPGRKEMYLWYRNGQGTDDQTKVENSIGWLIVQENKPDECEFKIPVSIFETIYGEPIGNFSELTVTNPNMFMGGVTIAGSSSGPWVGVGLCVLAACAGFAVYSGKTGRFGKMVRPEEFDKKNEA